MHRAQEQPVGSKGRSERGARATVRASSADKNAIWSGWDGSVNTLASTEGLTNTRAARAMGQEKKLGFAKFMVISASSLPTNLTFINQPVIQTINNVNYQERDVQL
ncbi:hypothetical protein J5X98_11125 [Leptothermofonsia sichuanensis E412]|uniref:hypothetical protein n=1 Tax=Leptothermofonsia sichuanensis TaxID=2917832 RepID=UPI001CA683D6|nr:hypothetical protein [Leptothermofonsia sichuanensis]QZZ22840.1 hypothetical protein J5X98_11125 [Leptothermofonsia sichuanensis E412]